MEKRYFHYCLDRKSKHRGVCPHDDDSKCKSKHLLILIFSWSAENFFSIHVAKSDVGLKDARQCSTKDRVMEKFTEATAFVYFDLLATDHVAMDSFIAKLAGRWPPTQD